MIKVDRAQGEQVVVASQFFVSQDAEPPAVIIPNEWNPATGSPVMPDKIDHLKRFAPNIVRDSNRLALQENQAAEHHF